MLGKAIAIAAQGFATKVDKSGEPYILHCMRVMNNLHTRDKELQSISILHDILEEKIIHEEVLLRHCNRNIKESIITTHKGNDFFYTTYRDTDPMISLFKLKNNDKQLFF